MRFIHVDTGSHVFRRSIGLLFAAVLIASCGGAGDESSSGRVRNVQANCFATEVARTTAITQISDELAAASSGLDALGDPNNLTFAYNESAARFEKAQAAYVAKADELNLALGPPPESEDVINRLTGELNLAAVERSQANFAFLDYKVRLAQLESLKGRVTQAKLEMDRITAIPVCPSFDASETTGAETSIDAAGETTTSVALETSTTIDGSTETTLLADENPTTTIEVVPTTAVSDQATVEDASTTTAPSTTIANATSETCADGTVLAPPAEVVVGEKFWVGLQGCTTEIQERTGQVFHLGHSAALNCPRGAESLNGIEGAYFECSLTVPGPETLIPWIVKSSERKKIKEFPFITVIARNPGGDVCRGQSPDGEIDVESRTVSVRYTCEKSTGLRIQALVDTPNGIAVVQTWLNQTSRQLNNLNFGNVLESYPKVNFVATHMCDDKEGRPRVVCGDPTLWGIGELPEDDATKPTTSATNPCLDPANPKYNCGWAMVDDNGTVTNAIVCSFEVCGTGAFAGSKVVLQTRQEPSGNIAGYGQGKYDASTNRFYPFGIPGPWFTGGDEWSEIRASLEATSVPMTTSTTIAPAASSTTVAPATTATPPNGVTTPTESSTTTVVATISTTTTTVATTAASAQPTSSEPTMVVTPLPASALQREDESAVATDNQGQSGADIALPIPVPDRATAMICDAQCVSDARSQAEADENATVEIEVADGLWIPAENAIVPVIPDGVALKFRVTPTSGTAVILGGQVASASVVLEKASQGLVTTSSDGSVEDSAGNVIGAVQNVGSVETQQSGFSTLLAFILAVFALITALLIAFLVKFFLKSRSSATVASDHSDREGKV